MQIADSKQIAQFTSLLPYVREGEEHYHDDQAAQVNRAVLLKTGGKLPCYAVAGKQVPFRWVSVGSSCGISRGVAKNWLARYGVNITEVEAMGVNMNPPAELRKPTDEARIAAKRRFATASHNPLEI